MLLACLSFTPSASAFDHYNPVALNESAVERIRDGDLGTARILLERAARLAPHNERILRNLRELKAQMDGVALADPAKESGLSVKADAERAQGKTGNSVLPEPPAIWKAN